MSKIYTTENIEGQTLWFVNGEHCAHTPDGLLLSLLKRTLQQAEAKETIAIREVERLEALLDAAWPMISLDNPEQYMARIEAIEEFRKLDLIA